ncbi:MAG: arginine N-succinyltransferase [Sphingomonadales bacterium]|nr:MAG: arginine N-succinyltransferase [Sphingomonadales bacterium]
MANVIRAAGSQDLQALYEMAKSTGGGFTNLPPDQEKLREKLAVASASFAREGDEIGDDKFMFLLEDTETGKARGTCQIFSRIGSDWPFYTYRIDKFAQYSKALERTISSELLTLCTDHSGATEVGGLFLNDSERSTGHGALLARSRYLFMHMHRSRFANRTIAELRGVDEGGRSPFWDAVGGRFFDMTFREADEFNAVHGNQFIADLMPKTAIYKAMLSEGALQVLGTPHLTGRPAMRMLEKEGFLFDKYVDIFDGGPTMTVATDEIATVRDAKDGVVIGIADLGSNGTESLIANGHLAAFRACTGQIAAAEGGVVLDTEVAEALGATIGSQVTHVPR